MPFLHWFRKKSRNSDAEGQAYGVEKFNPEAATVTKTPSGDSGQGSITEAISDDRGSVGRTEGPFPAAVASQQPARATAEPLPGPHFSVPIGAFYSKLPPHLLAPGVPHLTRLIEIGEEDVVINKETREAVIPLSILSLSCPDIFVRPIASSDEIPITFPVHRVLPLTAVEPPQEPASETQEHATQALDLSPDAPAVPFAEGMENFGETLVNKPQMTVLAPRGDSDEAGNPERHPTVRATTASGKIEGFELCGLGDRAETEIRLRLKPILSNFPPDLEQPSIRALSESGTEIFLPLEVILSQLDRGRVVVSAAMFYRALPDDVKPHFQSIDPAAEIPIPLQEIFLNLPAEAIKLREDQETDHPEASIQTPFSIHVEEDAKRLTEFPEARTAPGSDPTRDSDREEPTSEISRPAMAIRDSGSNESRAEVGEQDLSPPPPRQLWEISGKLDSERLQAILMTEELLDLPKAIKMIAELPGLRACLLNTTDGLKLAGNLEDPNKEQAISAMVSELFQEAQSKLASMHFGSLETISLYCGRDQLSTFLQGKYCLTVLHDNRPFKPGVREKVQAVMSELVTLGGFENQP